MKNLAKLGRLLAICLCAVSARGQVIVITSVSSYPNGVSFCVNSSVTVTYTRAGVFLSTNIDSLQMSDASGSFSNPYYIGRIVNDSTTNGFKSITGNIPAIPATGNGFKFRIVSTTAILLSSTNVTLSSYTVTANVVMPIITGGPAGIPCQGTLYTFNSTKDPNAATHVFSITPGRGTVSQIPANGNSADIRFQGSGATVTVTIKDSNVCSKQAADKLFPIIYDSIRTPTFTQTPPVSVCQGTLYNFTASSPTATSYAYTMPPIGGTLTSSGASATVRYRGAAYHPLSDTVTVTAYGNCGDSAKARFVPTTVNDTVTTPVFTSSGYGPVRCQGPGTVTYGAATVPAGTLAYSLSNSAAGTFNTSTGQLAYNASFSGTITITATATGVCGLPRMAQYSVLVNPAGALQPVAPLSICSGDSTRIPLASTLTAAQSPTNSFKWVDSTDPGITGSFADSTGGNRLNQKLTNLSNAALRNLKYFVTTYSSANCPSLKPDTVKVTVYPTPRLGNVAPAAICSGRNPIIKLISTTGAASSFSWALNAASSTGISTAGPNSANNKDTINNPTLTNLSDSTTNMAVYSVLVRSDPTLNSCSSTDTIKQAVLPKPTLRTTTPAAICSGGQTNIQLVGSVFSTFTYTVLNFQNNGVQGDTAGNGSSIIQTLINSNNSSANSVVYQIITTSVSTPGCSDTTNITQVVNPAPAISITGDTSVCSHSRITETITSSVAASFKYIHSGTGGLIFDSSATPGGLTSTFTIRDSITNINRTISGNFNYVVTGVTSVGCTTTVTSPSIRVIPKPRLTAANETICSGDSTHISFTGNNLSTSFDPYNDFFWTTDRSINYNGLSGDAGSLGGQFVSATGIRQILTSSNDSVQRQVIYIIVPRTDNRKFCVGDTTRDTITVNPIPTLRSATVKEICSNTPLNYRPTASTRIGVDSFSYSSTVLAGGTVSGNKSSAPGRLSAVGTDITDTLTTNGKHSRDSLVYAITLVNTNGTKSCSSPPYQVRVFVDPTPVAPGIDSAILPSSICRGTNYLNIKAGHQPDSIERYKWSGTNAMLAQLPYSTDNGQYALVSFDKAANTATISVYSYIDGYAQCTSPVSTRQVSLNNYNAPDVTLVMFNENLVARTSGRVKSYEWGYDTKNHLVPNRLNAGNNSSYYIHTPGDNWDPVKNMYWVLVTFDSSSGHCQQKQYYNFMESLGTGLSGSHIQAGITAYPNPVAKVLNVTLTGITAGETSIDILDLTGRIVSHTVTSTNAAHIPIEALTPGCYLVSCSQHGNRLATRKIIKQ